MSLEEAEKVRDTFFSTYPGVASFHLWQKTSKRYPKNHFFHNADRGFYSSPLVCSNTLAGRKRVWGWKDGRTLARDTELYNSPSQGTGADLLKAVMAEVYSSLPDEVKMIGSVHDELILEAPEALAHEAVNTLTNGLHSSDEKIAITAAVHILKVTGLYDGEWKGTLELPKTPEEAVWARMVKEKTKLYRGVRPDSFTDWSTKQWTEQVGKDLTIKWIDGEYEQAVNEQKKELREYKKKERAQEEQIQLPQIEPVSLTIEDVEEDIPQSDRPGPIKA